MRCEQRTYEYVARKTKATAGIDTASAVSRTDRFREAPYTRIRRRAVVVRFFDTWAQVPRCLIGRSRRGLRSRRPSRLRRALRRAAVAAATAATLPSGRRQP